MGEDGGVGLRAGGFRGSNRVGDLHRLIARHAGRRLRQDEGHQLGRLAVLREHAQRGVPLEVAPSLGGG